MPNAKFTCPNWAQALIARTINLDPEGITVRREDERNIVFLEYSSRKEYIVNKETGKVVVG